MTTSNSLKIFIRSASLKPQLYYFSIVWICFDLIFIYFLLILISSLLLIFIFSLSGEVKIKILTPIPTENLSAEDIPQLVDETYKLMSEEVDRISSKPWCEAYPKTKTSCQWHQILKMMFLLFCIVRHSKLIY